MSVNTEKSEKQESQGVFVSEGADVLSVRQGRRIKKNTEFRRLYGFLARQAL